MPARCVPPFTGCNAAFHTFSSPSARSPYALWFASYGSSKSGVVDSKSYNTGEAYGAGVAPGWGHGVPASDPSFRGVEREREDLGPSRSRAHWSSAAVGTVQVSAKSRGWRVFEKYAFPCANMRW